MFFLIMILLLVLMAAVVRIFTAPLRYGFRHRLYGHDPYDNPYRYGCRRHHRLLGGVLPIMALIALDRIFSRR